MDTEVNPESDRLKIYVSGMDAEAAFLNALVDDAHLTRILADRVAKIHAESVDGIPSILLKLGLLSEEDLARHMAQFADAERFVPSETPSTPVDLPGINTALLRSHGTIPLSASDGRIRLACWNTTDSYAVRALEFATGLRVVPVVGTRSELERASQSLYPMRDAEVTDQSASDDIGEMEELERLKDLASDAPIIRLVRRIVDEGVRSKTSMNLMTPRRGLQTGAWT